MSNTRKRLQKRAVAGAAASALLLPGFALAATPASAAPEFEAERLFGANRYETAANIATATYDVAGTVVIASGEVFPDALTGNYVAGLEDAPILLTLPDDLPDATEDALAALDPENIVIMGGTAAVSAAVEDELDDVAAVERVDGLTRYGTSAEAAAYADAQPTTAFLATGQNFRDALAAGPISYAAGIPILLTLPGELPEETAEAIAALGIETIIPVGGAAAISDGVLDEVAAIDGVTVEDRVFGETAALTAVELAEWAVAEGIFTNTGIALASGGNFPDALALAPAAAAAGLPLLLTQGAGLGDPAIDYIEANQATIVEAILAGGEAVLPASIVEELDEAAGAQDVVLVPSGIATTTEYQYSQVGRNATLAATVTAEPAEGSTTRQPVQGAEVTFQVPASGSEPARVLTGVTDAQGVATVTYTRNNPTNETVTFFVTSRPELRGTTQVEFNIAAAPVTLTPDDAATQAIGTTRTYTVTLQNPATGAATGGAVAISAQQLLDTDGTNNPTNANTTFAGVGGVVVTEDVDDTDQVLAVVTVPSTGTAQFTVSSSTAQTITPVAFTDTDVDTVVDANELRDAGGPVTFAAQTVTLAVTPDTAVTQTVNTDRAYTIQATDQFGNVYTGDVVVGFEQLLDNSAVTTTSAQIESFDADEDLTATPSNGAVNAQTATIDLNSQGRAVFTVTASSATAATPAVFVEGAAAGRQVEDPQDLGGTTTFVAAALTGAGLTGATMAPASATADPTVDTRGDVTYTFTFRDQDGNAIDPADTPDVTFTVQNTGSAPVVARAEGAGGNTTIAAGATQTLTVSAVADTDATVEVDAAGATTVSVTATSTVGSQTVNAGPVTTNWVAVDIEEPANDATVQTFSGTVVQVDKGADNTAGGTYVLQTGLGNVFLSYDMGDTFVVAGNSATLAQFEAALTVGDVVSFSDTTGDVETHSITTNNS